MSTEKNSAENNTAVTTTASQEAKCSTDSIHSREANLRH